MDDAGQRQHVPLLIGIGLVLVGLLAGILAMLLIGPQAATPHGAMQQVAQVEIGARGPARPTLDGPAEGPAVSVAPSVLNNLFREVADAVTPAVVYIQVSAGTGAVPGEWLRNFDEDARRRFFREHARQSVGSGVIISSEGYVVTNHHVVEGAEDIQVTLHDKRLYKARIVGTDHSTDLAVLQLEAPGEVPVIHLGNSDDVEVGEWVLAVGNPFRLTSTVTAGIVSALGRQVNIIDDDFRIEDFIQTDAAINPGNSGGAVVNLQGELVGIATAIATESGSYEGYGFAVPVNLMARVVQDLIAYGEVRRGFLGVTIQEVDARAARQLGLDRIGGVYVNDVRQGGAAHQAGLRDGDVVLAIDGRAVDAPNALQSVVARRRPGDRLDLEVWRRGAREHVEVELLGSDDPVYATWFQELNRAPDQQAPPALPPDHPDIDVYDLEDWGLGLRDLDRREREAFETRAGTYVSYVANGSLAARAGLPRDVVITEIAGQAVASTDDALRVLSEVAEREEAVLFRVRGRDGLSAFYELDMPGT